MRTYREYRELRKTATAEEISRQVALPIEARKYQGQRAGVVTRLIAGLIDVAIVALVIMVAQLLFAVVRFLASGSDWQIDWIDTAYHLFFGFVLFVLYMTSAWRTTGRSVGAQIMGLRVVNNDGLLLRTAPAFIRAVFLGAFPVGLFWAAFSSKNRSIQDVLLGSSVIYDWTFRVPKVEREKSRRANSAKKTPRTP